MTEGRRRAAVKNENARKDDVMITVESSQPMTTDVESARKELRGRWELASILHFLRVFEPFIEVKLKISAEEIETALIQPNSTLAHLHRVLLKGVISASKPLKDSDCWIKALIKELAPWWGWVAEGDFPLAGSKGKETSTYNELDPMTRLLILKALCEVRADQPDAHSSMTEAAENDDVSAFRKDKLSGYGKGIAFWCDGNETLGHRLYKEVHLFESNRVKGKGRMLTMNCQWETLATNLEEFNKVVNEFSSSGLECEVALSKSLEADVIPILEKHWKKKQKALLLKQRAQMPPVSFRCSLVPRSCRNRKTVNYTFDDYNKAITQAIQYTNKRKTSEEKQSRNVKRPVTTSHDSSDSDTNLKDSESTDTDPESNNHEEVVDDEADNSSQEEYEEEKEKEDDAGERDGKTRIRDQTEQQNMRFVSRSKNTRFSKRLAGIPGHTVPESMNLGAKNRLRERPSVNTSAVESVVVPDSDDENSV